MAVTVIVLVLEGATVLTVFDETKGGSGATVNLLDTVEVSWGESIIPNVQSWCFGFCPLAFRLSKFSTLRLDCLLLSTMSVEEGGGTWKREGAMVISGSIDKFVSLLHY